MGSGHTPRHLAAAVAMAMTPRQTPSCTVPSLRFLGNAPLSMVKGTLRCVKQSILLINGRAIRHISIAWHMSPRHSILLLTGLQVKVIFQDRPRVQLRATLLVRVSPQVQDTRRVRGSLHGRTSLHGRANLQVKASPLAKGSGREKKRGKERVRVTDTLFKLSTGSPRMGISLPLRPTMLWRQSPQITQAQPKAELEVADWSTPERSETHGVGYEVPDVYGEWNEGYEDTDAVICNIHARDIDWEGGSDYDTDTW